MSIVIEAAGAASASSDHPVDRRRSHHRVGHRGASADRAVTAAEEVELARRVEAGVLARQASDLGCRSLGASRSDCRSSSPTVSRPFAASRGNLALVGMVIRQMTRPRVAEADLFQDGCLGLMRLIRRLRPHPRLSGSRPTVLWVRPPTSRRRTATRGGQLDVTVRRADNGRDREYKAAQPTNRPRGLEAEVAVEARSDGRLGGRTAVPIRWMLATRRRVSPSGMARQTGRAPLKSILDEAMPGVELLDHLRPATRQVVRFVSG